MVTYNAHAFARQIQQYGSLCNTTKFIFVKKKMHLYPRWKSVFKLTHPALTGIILTVFAQGRSSESASITNLSSPPMHLFFPPFYTPKHNLPGCFEPAGVHSYSFQRVNLCRIHCELSWHPVCPSAKHTLIQMRGFYILNVWQVKGF